MAWQRQLLQVNLTTFCYSAKGLVCRLDEMLPEYYKLLGWDETGVPSTETLKRLELSG